MQQTDSIDYLTQGGIKISREVSSVAYENATESLITALNTRKGALFSSSFEFPGRYTRWDIGFVNPPLMMTACGRRFAFKALNVRGELLLAIIASMLGRSESVASFEVSARCIDAVLKPAERFVFEEDRSRQITVFSVLRDVISLFKSAEDELLGLYGAFAYDLAFQFEKIDLSLSRPESNRELVLYLPDEILLVDHRRESAFSYCYDFEFKSESTCLLKRDGGVEEFQFADKGFQSGCDHQPGEYAATVNKARKYFARGDLFEAVPGQMFVEKCIDLPADIFRRLQKANPAPYGALINLGEQEYLVAASPEMYVRVSGKRVETCPISGTIARGKDAIEDAEQIKTLLNSVKDESELSMCTDVDRNDKSRVCEPGSVRVIGRRQLELYSRLIHTVDHVEGRLKEGFDALDAFLSHTWAVTVTGAPKQAAMQFIEDHEKSSRRWYGGAMGYLGFNGDMNTGLTLRTTRIQNGVAEVRAGATLLFDSDPAAEEAETRLKASALLAAINGRCLLAKSELSLPDINNVASGTGKKVLMVDHQDSFVHTLASYFQEAGANVRTVRYQHFAEALAQASPDLVVLSPGPGRPSDFKLKETIALCLARKIPLFGVCLGLQGIAEYFGAELKVLSSPMHGKPSLVEDAQGPLFDGISAPFRVGRYHSLVAQQLPACLQVRATVDEGVIMALEHTELPVQAVQFHPESILSLGGESGRKIINNVLAGLN